MNRNIKVKGNVKSSEQWPHICRKPSGFSFLKLKVDLDLQVKVNGQLQLKYDSIQMGLKISSINWQGQLNFSFWPTA